MPRFVSIDLETSGLDPQCHEIIEVGMVRESSETVLERLEFSLPFDRQLADPKALEINGWGQREFAPLVRRDKAVQILSGWLDGAHIVGKNPSFDAGFLTALFVEYGESSCWHHRLVDVGAMAWGWHQGARRRPSTSTSQVRGLVGAQTYPPNSERVAELTGVPIPQGARHTALGDAEWVYQVFRKMVPNG